MKRTEQVNMLVSIIILITLIELLIFGGLGFAVPISVTIYYLFLGWRYRQYGNFIDFFKTPLLIIILPISLCFALFDNIVLKFFNSLFLISLVLLHASISFGLNTEEKYSMKWFLKILSLGIIMPFTNMNKAFICVKEELIKDDRQHAQLSSFKKIFIGCLLGIPLMLIAGFLLIFSDAAFEGVIDWLISQLNFDLIAAFQHILAYVLLSFPFMGFLYTLTHKDKTQETEALHKSPKVYHKLDFIISITIVTLLSSIYILYIFSQFTYFFSAFKGILPDNYTYAEYARRGFFEMLPLCGLNLGVIILLNLLTTGNSEKKNSTVIKGYTTFILSFTLFIIITALAKMVMYMNIYGLTLKRVFVTWILILVVISFILIGIKLYRNHFRLTKYLFISFCILYLSLNYSNIDYLIAKYNFNLYTTKQVNTIDSFGDLSSSGVSLYIQLAELQPSIDPPLHQTYLYYYYKNIIQDNRDWREDNLSHYLAVQKWGSYFLGGEDYD